MTLFPQVIFQKPFSKCLHDRGAPIRLDHHHARPVCLFFIQPAEINHFIERFPHTDEACAASSGINYNIRQSPVQLLCNLVSHSLFTFNPERFLQRGKVKPFFCHLFTHLACGLGDSSSSQPQVSTIFFRRINKGSRYRLRQENMACDPRSLAIGRGAYACVSC
jgi:hypothetical protein